MCLLQAARCWELGQMLAECMCQGICLEMVESRCARVHVAMFWCNLSVDTLDIIWSTRHYEIYALTK